MAINWNKPIRTVRDKAKITATQPLFSRFHNGTVIQAMSNGQWFTYHTDGMPGTPIAPKLENYEEETKVTALDVTKPVEYVIGDKDGGVKEAHILCADLKGTKYPVVFTFTDRYGEECVRTCDLNGNTASGYKLRNKKIKITGWINVYRFGDYTGPFDTEREALGARRKDDSYLTTVQIEYEV